jgi:hypothetical protein
MCGKLEKMEVGLWVWEHEEEKEDARWGVSRS